MMMMMMNAVINTSTTKDIGIYGNQMELRKKIPSRTLSFLMFYTAPFGCHVFLY